MQNRLPRILIFDFDGVIADSIPLKAEAFRETFSFVPGHQDEIVRYHLDNGGMSRYVKFQNIYRDILHQPLTREQEEALASRYQEQILQAMYSIPLIPGAEALLGRYAAVIPLYVVSATPEEEMHLIAERRGLAGFFVRIYGSPRSKADCIREILSLEDIHPEDALFVGDAPQDWQAAWDTGVRFIARVAEGDSNRFEDLPGVEMIVSDLHELGDYLASPGK